MLTSRLDEQFICGLIGKIARVMRRILKRQTEMRELVELDLRDESFQINPVGNVGDEPGGLGGLSGVKLKIRARTVSRRRIMADYDLSIFHRPKDA